MAANPIFHAYTRHIELDYHFVRPIYMLRFPVSTAPQGGGWGVGGWFVGLWVLKQLPFPSTHGSHLHNLFLAIVFLL
ncbi:unnamed protein product [Prunus brigantina]